MVQADPPTLAAAIATEALSGGTALRAREEKNSKAWGGRGRLISVVAGARNHLQANTSLAFRFEVTA